MRLPAGVRDWLPHELARKREIEAVIRGVFGRWAYSEVQTPLFERFDVIEKGLGSELTRETFRFMDRRATALALRPEMTTPIARLVSTRLRDAPLPLRLSYVAPAFRYYDEPQEGRMREFTQAGVELIGPTGLDADAETLFMAIEALDAIGLTDAEFDVNDVAVIDGVIAGLPLSPQKAHYAKELIAERNLVALRELGEPQLVEIAMLRGGDDVIAAARPLCHTEHSRAALVRLDSLLERARSLGYRDRVKIDLALLRDLEYYTGFIFEGFIGDIGFPLCGGGRYDSLLPRFGYDVGAVGWTAGVERLLIALERRGRLATRRSPRIDVLVSGSDTVAARERAAGNVVRIAGGTDDASLVAEARANGISRVLIGDDGGIRELRVRAQSADRLPGEVIPPIEDAVR